MNPTALCRVDRKGTIVPANRTARRVFAAETLVGKSGFGVFTRKSVRRGSFDSAAALVRHTERYLAGWDSHPTPFIWAKDPADIICKAVRGGVNATSRTRN